MEFGAHKHTLKDAIAELTVKPLMGIPVAIAVIYGFWSFFCDFAGTLFTDGFMVKIFDEHWLPWLQSFFPGGLENPFYALMVDAGHLEEGILVASDNCFEGFGVAYQRAVHCFWRSPVGNTGVLSGVCNIRRCRLFAKTGSSR